MTIIDILQYPDPRLKRKGIKVTDFGAALQKLVDDMFATHYAAENCAALAATQLDIDPAPHVTVIDFSPGRDEPLCIVNGEIVACEGQQYEEEGCMSVGYDKQINLHTRVKRALKITAKGQDRYGQPLRLTAEGFLAKCIQHELDHLDGKLYLDRISVLKRNMVEKKLAKARKPLPNP